MREISVGFDLSLKLIIALKINVSIWIFDINNKRVFLAHFKIVIS